MWNQNNQTTISGKVMIDTVYFTWIWYFYD
jgi:hypothetical protein